MQTLNLNKKIYIHAAYEEIMSEDSYDDDSFIIVDLQSEADCYYKKNGKVELVDICDSVYDAIQLATQHRFLA